MASLLPARGAGCMGVAARPSCSGLTLSRPAASARPSRTPALRTTALFNMFAPKEPPARPPPPPKRETVVLEPSYNLQAGLLAISGGVAWAHELPNWIYWGTPLAAFTGLLGLFLTIQAQRISFVFDDEAFEIKRNGAETDNVVVGGRNRWPYDSFINWEFWWPGFPILVYFKEDQTTAEGQVHFFPIIFNGRQLYEVMLERCGTSMGSGPKMPPITTRSFSRAAKRAGKRQ